jgi:outer membrane protein assembly factor BamD (BamD/ComL family)
MLLIISPGGKTMRKILMLLCLSFALAGCSDRAEDLYETARFEEKQFNQEHAGKLYREIIEKFPDSPYADRARERLAELEAKDR